MSCITGDGFLMPLNDPTGITLVHPTFIIHPLLRQDDPLQWDLRLDIISAGHTSLPNFYLTRAQLLAYATSPPMSKLQIICGVLPEAYGWEMTATNPSGVTVIDVLESIHGCLKRQITVAEWESLSAKQRDRVSAVFDDRWRAADFPDMAHAHGVLRQDCILHHTLFKGLSPSFEDSASCVLTLGRVPPNVQGG